MDKHAAPAPSESEQNYTVVARRYRPKSFTELIGQDHIAQALTKAIATGRVGHAYLFTGARGVGKTSTARIFAKALNVGEGSQDLAADIAQSIDAGDDMDVIEIDGASNRGIEEIRQLRANVNVRPSRAAFKIYIIDEVHMLTTQAFNALLKTLEEPPAHVKFIFCTTDPDKIPITVLSRCQRFDFAPVKFEAIQQRLQEISQAEGYQVEPEALALLARRAAGSMRDSQSLLEQVMSFASETISVEQVHALLGTADEGQLLAIVGCLCEADALAAIELVDQAMRAGADPGQLTEQLLNYLRDLMAVGVGGGPQLLKLANPMSHSQLLELAGRWGLQSILSAIQLLDESLVRMRSSVSATTLLEVALVQICQLEQLASIPAMIEAVQQGLTHSSSARRPASAGEKKNAELNPAELADRQLTGTSGLPAPHLRTAMERAGGKLQPASSGVSNAQTTGVSMASPPISRAEPPTIPPAMSSGPVGDTALSPIGDTALSPAGDTALSPVGDTALSPTGDTALSPVGDTAIKDGTGADRAIRVGANAPNSSVSSAGRGAARVVADASAAASPSTQSPAGGRAQEFSARHTAMPSSQALADWQRAVATIDGMLADYASLAVAVEPQGSDRWTIQFSASGQKSLEYCEPMARRTELQKALRETIGREIQLSFALQPGEVAKPAMAAPQAALRAQKIREIANDPYIKQVCEILGGEIIRVDSSPGTPPARAQPAPDHQTMS